MLPENRTYISPHQYNSRPSVVHAPTNSRGAGQPQDRQLPPRPLNVQPRVANPFHAFHRQMARHRIYDRLHPRNMYRALTLTERPQKSDSGVEVEISHSDQQK